MAIQYPKPLKKFSQDPGQLQSKVVYRQQLGDVALCNYVPVITKSLCMHTGISLNADYTCVLDVQML